MNVVKLKFTLKKPHVMFSEQQKEDIGYYVNLLENWKNLRDLVTVELLEIGDNYFIVEADETANQWHAHFSRKLCKQVDLFGLAPDNVSLFNVDYD